MEAFSVGERGLDAPWIGICMSPRHSVDAVVNKYLLLLCIELQIVRIPAVQQLSFKNKNLVNMKFSDKLTFFVTRLVFKLLCLPYENHEYYLNR